MSALPTGGQSEGRESGKGERERENLRERGDKRRKERRPSFLGCPSHIRAPRPAIVNIGHRVQDKELKQFYPCKLCCVTYSQQVP